MAINGIVQATDFGLYYGWSPNADTMVVMPGHNNQVGNFISRQYQQVNGTAMLAEGVFLKGRNILQQRATFLQELSDKLCYHSNVSCNT